MTPAAILRWWRVRRKSLLLAGLVLMGVAAVARWPYEMGRAVIRPDPPGLDLRLRYDEVQAWFAGQSFAVKSSSTYPPASYPLLWAAIGWMEFPAARWVWATTNIALLAWLAAVGARESLARDQLERTFVAAFFFSGYAPLVTIGNGQLTIVVIAALVASVMAWRCERWWLGSTASAAAMLAALVKPNLSAPFFWLLVFAAPSRVSAALVIAGYAALTWFAGLFQPEGLLALFRRWAETSAYQAQRFPYSDLPVWLDALGIGQWSVPAALLLLGLAGAGVWRFRNQDAWLLLGMMAVVSRLWATHRVYDDLLLFVAMVALLRVAWRGGNPSATVVVAGVLFAGNWLAQIAPASLLVQPAPVSTVYKVVQTGLWVGTLLFLGWVAERGRTAADADTG